MHHNLFYQFLEAESSDFGISRPAALPGHAVFMATSLDGAAQVRSGTVGSSHMNICRALLLCLYQMPCQQSCVHGRVVHNQHATPSTALARFWAILLGGGWDLLILICSCFLTDEA